MLKLHACTVIYKFNQKPLLLCTARFETWLQVPSEAIDTKTCLPMRPRGVDNIVIGAANAKFKGHANCSYTYYLIVCT